MQTPGIRYLHKLLFSLDELQWLQAEGAELTNLGAFFHPGLVVSTPIRSVESWQAYQSGPDGASATVGVRLDPDFEVAAAYAIDSDGSLRVATEFYDTDGAKIATLELPDDDTWYTLVTRWVRTEYEPGTLTLNGTTTVTGVGTDFTRYTGFTDGGYDRGTLLRIDEADTVDGDEGKWEIDEIASATSLTLRAAVPGTESGVPFTVQGRFYNDDTPADPDIHNRWVPVLEAVARTRTPAAGDFVIADVKFNSAGFPSVTVIDRREANIAWPRRDGSEPRPASFDPLLTWADETVGSPLKQQAVPFTAGGGVAFAPWGVAPVELAGTNTTGLLAIANRGDNVVRTATWNPLAQAWSAEATAWSAAGNGLPIVKVPTMSGYTHAAFYTRTDVLYMRRSTDHGASWSGETAIWNGLANDAADDLGNPDAILLRNGRLVVVVPFQDSSVNADYNIRYIYSDDYGTTWSTNASAGWDVIGFANGDFINAPKIAQDPVTGRIYTVGYENDSGDTFVAMSADEADPAPADPTSVPRLLDVSAIGQAYVSWVGDVWVDPISGMLVLVAPVDPAPTTFADLLRFVVCRPHPVFGNPGTIEVVGVTQLWDIANRSMLWVQFIVDEGGLGHILWWDPAGTPDGNVSHARVSIGRALPSPMP